MKYLIDGHNLIPKVGLKLSNPEDEAYLLERLREFARLTGRSLEVFFDKGANGFAHEQKVGTIKVHFVSGQTTADEVIINRVSKAKRPEEIIVVSSDRHVQVQARGFGARVAASEKFADEMRAVFTNPPKRKNRSGSETRPEPLLSDREVNYWADVFRSGRSEKYSK